MKVRWTSSSVRLRITPQELANLQSGSEVCETLALSSSESSAWKMRVEVAASTSLSMASLSTTSLSMQNGVLTFSLAPDDLARLLEPRREGVYFSQDGVRFYIEKDFPCAHPRAGEADEEPTETFSPPRDFEERKN